MAYTLPNPHPPQTGLLLPVHHDVKPPHQQQPLRIRSLVIDLESPQPSPNGKVRRARGRACRGAPVDSLLQREIAGGIPRDAQGEAGRFGDRGQLEAAGDDRGGPGDAVEIAPWRAWSGVAMDRPLCTKTVQWATTVSQSWRWLANTPEEGKGVGMFSNLGPRFSWTPR